MRLIGACYIKNRQSIELLDEDFEPVTMTTTTMTMTMIIITVIMVSLNTGVGQTRSRRLSTTYIQHISILYFILYKVDEKFNRLFYYIRLLLYYITHARPSRVYTIIILRAYRGALFI